MATRRAKAAVDATDAPRTEDAPIELTVVGVEPVDAACRRDRALSRLLAAVARRKEVGA